MLEIRGWFRLILYWTTLTFAKQHEDWLQLSFDKKHRAVFYGKKVFWVEPNDESAWMCPNSPYRDWLQYRLARLAATGIDGLWLDVPLFGLVVGKWGCACHYCQTKFTKQTGLEFPETFDIRDKSFWRYVQWRHQTLTEFMESCRQIISAANPKTVTIAEVVSLDHLGATLWGTEGSQMKSHFIVWEQDAVSVATGMADAHYDDWIAQYSSFKYCRGATLDKPSWSFSYSYNKPDAQLVMAGLVASQNNPYELRTPKMTTTLGKEFRGMMFNWIAKHSKLIYKSKSLASVAIIYSENNRDFLDIQYEGGLIIQGSSNHRDRRWLGTKRGSPIHHEYMGDYRGLSMMMYQHQIPTDIYPITRIDKQLLQEYPVLILPYMAMMDDKEKSMLLAAVENGSTLIVTGSEPGYWQSDGSLRPTSIWGDLLNGIEDAPSSHRFGKGKICFWRNPVGRNYLKSHSKQFSLPILTWLNQAGIKPWLREQQQVVVQPYVYQNKIVIHVLNYAWVGSIKNQPHPIQVSLTVPWQGQGKNIIITQSEPSWKTTKQVQDFSFKDGNLIIPLSVGINALVTITI